MEREEHFCLLFIFFLFYLLFYFFVLKKMAAEVYRFISETYFEFAPLVKTCEYWF